MSEYNDLWLLKVSLLVDCITIRGVQQQLSACPMTLDAAPAGVPFYSHFGVLYGSKYEFVFKT